MPELLQQVHTGDTVIIKSSERKLVVGMEVLSSPQKKPIRLGAFHVPGFKFGDAFWEPLPEGCDGTTESPNDPLFLKAD
ncbi:MAG TPA: toxin-antitoxin system subunit antitoxin [Acidobacteriaceae bacterium]|nr:toxin-antitoxin system subunit antitoxin [Acidobacteriaceae bacterium]